MAAIAVPVVGGTLDRERTIVGAQYLAGQLQRARLESLKRARAVAVRLEVVGDRTQLQLFADGNGNGVLQRDIDRGIDPPLTPTRVARRSGARHLVAHQSGRHGRRRDGDARARRRSAAHRQYGAADVQPARQCHERHALCRGASGSTNGDSCLRSDRPCPRVDVRCADAAMAPVAIDLIERRRERRSAGGGARWQARAVLRPGQPVTLLNISSRAALVESAARLRPGAHTEMQLAGAGDSRASVAGTARSLLRRGARADALSRRAGVRQRVDIGDVTPRSRVASARRAWCATGHLLLNVHRGAHRDHRISGLNSANRVRIRSWHHLCYGHHRTMDASPNITIAVTRSCAAPIVAPASICCCAHVASDLVDTIRSAQPVGVPHAASRAAGARAQHRI